MTFLSTGMLYGLGALLVPVIIHLWRQRRVVQVRFSTLRYLKLAAARTSRSSRIENVLLLFLRCLLFALLVLAAARPVLSSGAARLLGGDVPRTVVLAIDNSMSMACRVNGTTRLEAAKAQALAVIDHLKPGDDVAVMAIGATPQLLVAEPTVDHEVARRMVGSIVPGESLSDFPAVFREARKIVARGTHGLRELYFFTDSQESAWRFDPKPVFDEAWKQSGLHPVVVRPDNFTPSNAAVANVKISSPFATAGALIAGVATVENFSGNPLQDVLEIRVGGERVTQKPVEIAPGSSMEVAFEARMPELAGHWAEGIASIEGDNLTADDQFYFALPVFQQPKVLVVEGQQAGEPRLRSGYYLGKALAAGSGAMPKIISSQDLDETGLDGFSAVFLADAGNLSDRALARFERYLQSGGTIAYFPGELADPAALSRMDFLPAKMLEVSELPPGRLAALISEPGHPLLANAWDKDTPFPALPQKKLARWKLGADAKSLLTFSNGTPFVVFAQQGPGRVFIVNASADRAWGDFPLSPAFLPLVQQIARFSSEESGGDSARTVGAPLPVTPNLPADQPLTLKLPDGTQSTLPAGEKSVLTDRADSSGFYEAGPPQDPARQVFSVNTDRRESDLRTIAPAALEKIVPIETVAGLDELNLWLAKSRGVVPLWPALLLLALAVFAAEATVANLLARNRSQGDEHHIKTGRLNKRRTGVSFHPAETEAKF
ncbi:MAG: BatA domain-containing protein [Verrucomicrobiota bacterium]